jgi:hypothetical protein
MFTLYIPDYVTPMDIDLIKETFEKLEIAKVREVEFLPHLECEYNVEPEMYGAARVHIDYWFENECAQHMQDRIRNPYQEARLVFDDPTYWLIEQDEDDTEKIISRMSNSIRETDEKITKMNNYLHYNYSCVHHLMSEDRKRYIKDNKKRKSEINYKAQKKWQRRLRSRTNEIILVTQ